MAEVAENHGVQYPVARDAARESEAAWAVKGWPTYAVIDRKGKLRALGAKGEHVQHVVKALIREP